MFSIHFLKIPASLEKKKHIQNVNSIYYSLKSTRINLLGNIARWFRGLKEVVWNSSFLGYLTYIK